MEGFIGQFSLVSNTSSKRTRVVDGRAMSTGTEGQCLFQDQPASCSESSRRPASSQPARRHHTKSRRGCLTCKTRKVKCGEELPACRNCESRSIDCIYATVMPRPQQMTPRIQTTPPVQPSLSLYSGPPSAAMTYHLLDLRLFHHFLTATCHPLPLKNQVVWATQIPQLALEYHYLMDAILAFSASQLHRKTSEDSLLDESRKRSARAITGLNIVVNDPQAWKTFGPPDAILSSCYLLTYQTSYNPDGLFSFLQSVSGCAIATEKIRRSQVKTSLQVSSEVSCGQCRIFQEDINLTPAEETLVLDGVSALDDIQSEIDLGDKLDFLKAIRTTLVLFHRSPPAAWKQSSKVYSVWYHVAGHLLQNLRHRRNFGGILLSAMFLSSMLMLNIVVPSRVWPEKCRHSFPATTVVEMVEWINVVDAKIPKFLTKQMEWPRSVVNLLSAQTETLHSWRPAPTSRCKSKHIILENIGSRAHELICDLLILGSTATTWFESVAESLSPMSDLLRQDPHPRVPRASTVVNSQTTHQLRTEH